MSKAKRKKTVIFLEKSGSLTKATRIGNSAKLAEI
jgi:hypothetical protein